MTHSHLKLDRCLLALALPLAGCLLSACEGDVRPGAAQGAASPSSAPPAEGTPPEGSASSTPLGTPDAPAGPAAPGVSTAGSAAGCRPLVHAAGAQFGGVRADTYAWYDAACKLRTSGIVPSDAPGGGGYARGFTYETGGRTRNAFGTTSDTYKGFGYVVTHYAGTATSTVGRSGGSHRVVLAGAHHAIHEYKARISPGGPVDVTVHWLFATGRSNPIYAITYDASASPADSINADTRSPYGDIAFDEGPGSDNNVDGVGWGDKYKFVSTATGPLSFASGWDYTQPNTIPYAMEWANKADAEMGIVQTQTFAQHPAGGDYGGGLITTSCWGKTNATAAPTCKDPSGLLPNSWLWPMQLNQYELPSTTKSHRIAWGATYGAVGKKQYSAFGQTYSGYPYNSYSVSIVLGPHSAKAVDAQRAEFEANQSTRITAPRGSVAPGGPGGVGRNDIIAYTPSGYNPVYAAWELIAAQNAVTAQITVGNGASLKNPVFRVRDVSLATLSHVRVGGKELAADSGYFATIDAASKVIWITLNQTLTGANILEID
jgi:hypothetical protein